MTLGHLRVSQHHSIVHLEDSLPHLQSLLSADRGWLNAPGRLRARPPPTSRAGTGPFDAAPNKFAAGAVRMHAPGARRGGGRSPTTSGWLASGPLGLAEIWIPENEPRTYDGRRAKLYRRRGHGRRRLGNFELNV